MKQCGGRAERGAEQRFVKQAKGAAVRRLRAYEAPVSQREAFVGEARVRPYLMRKLSLVSFVPFISSRIHTGVMPLPVHFSDLFFFD